MNEPAQRDTHLWSLLAPIETLFVDDAVSEILINGPGDIWIESNGRLRRTDLAFMDRDTLNAALTAISQHAGRPFDTLHPVLETRLPDGSRLEAVREPISRNGTSVSIRRFRHTSITVDTLVNGRSFTRRTADYLAGQIHKKKNIVVSGGTGSGKTTLLNVLSSFIPHAERVLVLEDTHEIELQQPHVVYLESRCADNRGRGEITIRDLLRASLRMRPDRIVIGEIRGAEAFDLVQAMNTGHGGCMSTIHASSPLEALFRLENLVLSQTSALPHEALKTQLSHAIDLIVQVDRTAGGHRRITAVDTIDGMRDGRYCMTSLLRDVSPKIKEDN